jgi:hypothetical protein
MSEAVARGQWPPVGGQWIRWAGSGASLGSQELELKTLFEIWGLSAKS